MRHDHTKWITHFVRDRVPEQDFPGESEEEAAYYSGGELEWDAGAFQVLKTIIRLGGITPGYSFRKGRTTIYGGQPAVCATEMPLYSFATYVRDRSDSSKVSAYGIAFLKSEFFEAGGRPVIYGFSKDDVSYKANTSTRRIFASSTLPIHEQFRYVAYNPANQSDWIDWSHEREWRWVVRDSEVDEIWVQDANGIYGPTPALPIFKGKLQGRPFTQVCIIVWNHEEAKEIQELLTGLYLAKANNYDTPFDTDLISASSIVVLEDVIDAVEKDKDLDAQTLEGLSAANLLQPIKLAAAPNGIGGIVKKAMKKAKAAADKAAKQFKAKHGSGGGYCGYADAITYDVTNATVQYLLTVDLASGPFDGVVVIKFPNNQRTQSMDLNEAICAAAAKALSKELGIEVHMQSMPD